ncbi:MAG: hypothetical protein MET45_30095 [Nostoc sp. LLA-1]|nr:hypothetical protein [Cyanocohniella sp. LLY]
MEQTNRPTAKRQRREPVNGTSRVHKLDWDARYGNHDKYRKHCAIAHRKTLSTCVVCLKAKSEQIHHAMYGNDRIGVTTFPVCSHCHEQICHSKENWIKSRSDPVWGNRNTPGFVKRLKLGFELLYGGINV